MLEKQNTIISSLPSSVIAEATSATKDPKKGGIVGPDPLLLAYMWLFQSVQTAHDTANIQSKALNANAAAQDKLINESELHVQEFTHNQLYTIQHLRDHHQSIRGCNPGNGAPIVITWYTTRDVVVQRVVPQGEIAHLNATNQQVSADRETIEDQLIVLRQGAQVKASQLNSSVDEDQQTIQQGSSLLQMLTQLTNQITRI